MAFPSDLRLTFQHKIPMPRVSWTSIESCKEKKEKQKMEFGNDWQLLIKTARIRDRKYRRRGYTFEAKNIGVKTI